MAIFSTFIFVCTKSKQSKIKYRCITLPVSDKKAACAAFQGFLKGRGIAMMECEIECCTGDNCNTNFPSFSKRGKHKLFLNFKELLYFSRGYPGQVDWFRFC